MGGLAEVIHRRSRRAGAPFVTIDCAAMSESTLESTMFGCAGVGAGEAAAARWAVSSGRTAGRCYLAHVDAMSSRLQARLMQFLENGEIRRVGDLPVHRKVDVRVMTSAECSLFAHTAAHELPRGSLLPAERDAPRAPADVSAVTKRVATLTPRAGRR